MSQDIVLNQRQAHALLLQRTGYQPTYARVLRKARLGHVYDERISRRYPERQRVRLGDRYLREVEREAVVVQAVIPPNPRTVIDIGCGLAGFDLALTRLCPSIERLILVDQDKFETRPHYGFEATGSAYNSLGETVHFLKANGVTTAIRTVDALTEPFPSDERADTVVSLISWGHHYPVATYATQVHAVLNPGGVAILDVRRGSDGLTVLTDVFGAAPEPLLDQLDPSRTLRVLIRKSA